MRPPFYVELLESMVDGRVDSGGVCLLTLKQSRYLADVLYRGTRQVASYEDPAVVTTERARYELRRMGSKAGGGRFAKGNGDVLHVYRTAIAPACDSCAAPAGEPCGPHCSVAPEVSPE